MVSRLWIALFLVLSCLAQNPRPAKRHALLIGNSSYEKLPKIPVSAKNVEDLELALRGADFELTTVRDLTLEKLSAAQDAFAKRLQPGDAALVFYSGYAIQVRKENFLLPVNYTPSTTMDEVPYQAFSVTRLQQALDERKPSLKIFAIDASWELPGDVASSGPGMTTPDISETSETMVAFAAQPGQVISPPSASTSSPFSAALAEAIRKPGLTLSDVFLSVQQSVSRKSQQRPFVLPNVTATFYFRQPLVEKPAVSSVHLYKQNRKDRQDYVFIKPGTFMMGCVPADKRCDDDEKPRHQVVIGKGFWMGTTEVDILAWKRYVAASPKVRKMPAEAPMWDRKRSIENHPIAGVVWEEARDFCVWTGGRLPTEAEWEYASRAGGKDEIWPLNAENSRDKANFYGKKGNDLSDNTTAVRSFDPNAFGLYDMAGNVWEWVSDWYSPNYYQISPERDPQGPETGKKHTKRGGSFDSDSEKHLRLSIRRAGVNGNNLGFRCVLDNTEEVKALFGVN